MSAPTLDSATPNTALSACRIDFQAAGKSFTGERGTSRTVLEDVSLTAYPGEIISIVGTSGCGKSTLLRVAAGLDTVSTGQVHIDGSAVHGLDPRVAIGFQEPRLLPWRSVAKNVALGLPRGTPAALGHERVGQLLKLVGLEGYANHRPREISGGMAQRASLARALARNPGVLLLDEPFGALDALTRIKMQDLLLDIHAQDPATILLVTHDVDEALYLSDRVVVLGKPTPDAPATIIRTVEVSESRPRDRSNPELLRLRTELLADLGLKEH